MTNDKTVIVTFENFKEYLGKAVIVEIIAKGFGLMYPDDNILTGMSEYNYYFFSQSCGYWHYALSEKDCDICVFLK